ncbi:MAG: septum formation family protein [bacterium]
MRKVPVSVIVLRAARVALAVAVISGVLAGCSWFGGGKSGTASESVFSVVPGQCFQAPGKVQAELSSVQRVACTKAHTREAYAIVPYTAPAGTTGSAYPGSDALSSFAKGACAQRYGAYVGVDYLDSSLFFTYLVPSARSWEQDNDRKIICFVTTTGAMLTKSVKGSKL